jgi:hypothetical protein
VRAADIVDGVVGEEPNLLKQIKADYGRNKAADLNYNGQ